MTRARVRRLLSGRVQRELRDMDFYCPAGTAVCAPGTCRGASSRAGRLRFGVFGGGHAMRRQPDTTGDRQRSTRSAVIRSGSGSSLGAEVTALAHRACHEGVDTASGLPIERTGPASTTAASTQSNSGRLPL